MGTETFEREATVLNDRCGYAVMVLPLQQREEKKLGKFSLTVAVLLWELLLRLYSFSGCCSATAAVQFQLLLFSYRSGTVSAAAV